MLKLKLFILFITFQFISLQAIADDNSNSHLLPWTEISVNFTKSYSGWKSLYHIAALGITYASVQSGFDALVLKTTARMNPSFCNIFGHVGVMTGYAMPIVVPATMYIMSDNNSDFKYASYAVMQSVAITFAVGTLLKAITGRIGPDPEAGDKDALSRDFKFGFMQGGLHYGWPSGHLMVNTAMASALAAFYPEKTWIKNCAYGYIAFLTVSIIIHDRGRAHWFSDIVAGGLMGFTFGPTIGKNFRNYRDLQGNNLSTTDPDDYSVHLYPQMSPEYTGILVRFGF